MFVDKREEKSEKWLVKPFFGLLGLAVIIIYDTIFMLSLIAAPKRCSCILKRVVIVLMVCYKTNASFHYHIHKNRRT